MLVLHEALKIEPAALKRSLLTENCKIWNVNKCKSGQINLVHATNATSF